MKVLVYVEGPADQNALDKLLEPIVSEGRSRGVGIRLIPLRGKGHVLDNSPRKAADHLSEHPGDWVFALPDLYPMSAYDGTRNAHQSFTELEQLLVNRFIARANKVRVTDAARTHFRVHCLKYDLEVLLLAASDALRQRLGTNEALRGRWRNPVEDQNDQALRSGSSRRCSRSTRNASTSTPRTHPGSSAGRLSRASLRPVRSGSLLLSRSCARSSAPAHRREAANVVVGG
jgi:hypothetical protein